MTTCCRRLINAEEDGQRLSHDQVIATSVLLMQAGHETTTDSIGNALVALLRAPDQLELLRDDSDLTRNAVEELFRYDSTNQFNNRLLLDDVTVGGVPIAAGEQVAIVIGAANRDPVQFPDPDVLQLARPTPQHVAFAFGTYYCVGNALARTEVQVALRSLLDHFPTLAPRRRHLRVAHHPAQPRPRRAPRRVVTPNPGSGPRCGCRRRSPARRCRHPRSS